MNTKCQLKQRLNGRADGPYPPAPGSVACDGAPADRWFFQLTGRAGMQIEFAGAFFNARKSIVIVNKCCRRHGDPHADSLQHQGEKLAFTSFLLAWPHVASGRDN